MVDKERICLDPAEVAYPDRTELELHEDEGPIRVGQDGVDWGEAAFEVFWAQHRYGETPVDWRVPNRVVTIPLVIEHGQGVEFEEARAELQAKVARLAAEGGHLRRTMSDGSVLYLDVVGASLRLSGDSHQALHGIDKGASLVLQCLPDFYGEEVVATSEPVGIEDGAGTVLIDRVRGNYPARCEITVQDESSVDHMGVLYATRSRFYSDDATAALIFEAEDLEPLGTASTDTDGSASGGSVIELTGLSQNWTPVAATSDGSDELTHVGDYRVLARVKATAEPDKPASLRWSYAHGSLDAFSDLDPVTLPGVGQWFIADLGVVRIPSTAERWLGVLQAKGAQASSDVVVDRIILAPATENAGRVVGALSDQISTAGFAGQDRFQQSAGALTGKTPEISTGDWAVVSGSDTTDFQVSGSGSVTRVPGADDTGSITAINGGRMVLCGTGTAGAVRAQIDVELGLTTPSSNTNEIFLITRYVDSSNFAYCQLRHSALGSAPAILYHGKVVSGVDTQFNGGEGSVKTDARKRLVHSISSSGVATAEVYSEGGALLATHTISDPDLAAGGTLASGRFGFAHAVNGSSLTGLGVTLYDFFVFAPVNQPAIHADKSLVLSTFGCLREAADGDGWGRTVPYGDLPRLPVSGAENRPVELLVAVSRGDFDQMPDPALDDVSVTVKYRPCWLNVPEPEGGSGS